jgi:hypothetical protein
VFEHLLGMGTSSLGSQTPAAMRAGQLSGEGRDGRGIGLQYNGCKWKGSQLRVEQAKPAIALQLQREWADAARDALRHKAAAAAAAAAAPLPPLDTTKPLLLPSRDTRKVG